MTVILNKILGFFGISLQQLIVIGALCLAFLFAGIALANGWAADAVLKQASSEVKTAKIAAAAQVSAAEKLQTQAAQKARDADMKSASYISAQETIANLRAELARSYIEKEHANVSTSFADNTVVGGAELRRLLDASSGNCDGDGSAADTSTVVDKSVTCTGTASVTVYDLKNGYVALGTAYRGVRAQLQALQLNLNEQLTDKKE